MRRMPILEYHNPGKNFMFYKYLSLEELEELRLDLFENWAEIALRTFAGYSKFNKAIKDLAARTGTARLHKRCVDTSSYLVHQISSKEGIRRKKNHKIDQAVLQRTFLDGYFEQDKILGSI